MKRSCEYEPSSSSSAKAAKKNIELDAESEATALTTQSEVTPSTTESGKNNEQPTAESPTMDGLLTSTAIDLITKQNSLAARIKFVELLHGYAKVVVGDNVRFNLYDKIDSETIHRIKNEMMKSTFGSELGESFRVTPCKYWETSDVVIEADYRDFFDDIRCDMHLQKMIMYEAGGRAEARPDVYREGQAGTFIIELKTDHCGGDLLILDPETDTHLNVFNTIKLEHEDSLPAVYFPHALPQVVRGVESGVCITLVFKVMRRFNESFVGKITKHPCMRQLRDSIKNLRLGDEDTLWCSDTEIKDMILEENENLKADRFVYHDGFACIAEPRARTVLKMDRAIDVKPREWVYEYEMWARKDEFIDAVEITHVIPNRCLSDSLKYEKYAGHINYIGTSADTREYDVVFGWIITTRDHDIDFKRMKRPINDDPNDYEY